MDKDLYQKLREPFDIRFVSWKINNYNAAKTKAMITFYLDARSVQHRLNQVLGVDGWGFQFSELEKAEGVHGKLTIFFYTNKEGEGDCVMNSVTREDVGYSSTTEKSEWYKDAVSDALKRCAVHFGVGHFLYALPNLWVDLKESGQKYLDDVQNEYIKNWLQGQIDKMMPKSKSKEGVKEEDKEKVKAQSSKKNSRK